MISFSEVVFYVFKLKVKVTHKKCFARQTVRVFKKVGKLIEKHGVREFVLLLGGGRYMIHIHHVRVS